jgi:hypothetical protein
LTRSSLKSPEPRTRPKNVTRLGELMRSHLDNHHTKELSRIEKEIK